ncbi:MAG: methylated-DNA--[protein]-cysteine S-methyltransferase [Euryarchaeota archaeon]|nr:methylated-DNA--[protein]-cysteine S-methyltransferase [Euryarchaeota archaeon]MBU4492506.1 methylated-DNA--[protein]-cysteine S-methyltransferase [Euryarchaeota archaeon]MCG2727504.1 methylated-DNA--[protein]-cysteine S-methyltransferase [Candidatus Methanoperedenaceae archaeon]
MTCSIDIIFAKALGCYIEIDYGKKLRSIRFVKSKEYLNDRKTQSTSYDLERYFKGEKIDFSCELDISHLSPFTQKLLEETRKIRYGTTITYSELARNIGCRGARAVGGALANNPIPIVIPCHRVVAKHGIGGYSAGADIKTRLLELEKAKANNL